MGAQNESKNTSYSSCFDVIGPVMVGPSSSHTAGAINIGAAAQKIFKEKPNQIIVNYYESFAETHQGHGTDFAIISGILGFAYDDSRVPHSVEMARSEGIEIEFIENEGESPFGHPNTADITLINENKITRLVGISVGGGKIEVRHIHVDDFIIEPTGSLPALLVIAKSSEIAEQFEHRFDDEKLVVSSSFNVAKKGRYLSYYEIQHHFPISLFDELKEFENVIELILL